jgi:hypothetical protein
MKAEYIAASEAICIRNSVSKLGVVVSSPMDLYCDNSGSIAQAKEPRSHKKSKHVLRHYRLIHEKINQGDVRVCKVHMNQDVADPLTKPLPRPKHEIHMRSMGIRYLHQ